MKYIIFIVITVITTFTLTGFVRREYADDFYVEVLTDKPLKNIVVDVVHTGPKSCSGFLGTFLRSAVQHGSGLPPEQDYHASKLTPSNTKVKFETPGWISTGCFPDIGAHNISVYNFSLAHPEIDQGAYGEGQYVFYKNKMHFPNRKEGWPVQEFQGKKLYLLRLNAGDGIMRK